MKNILKDRTIYSWGAFLLIVSGDFLAFAAMRGDWKKWFLGLIIVLVLIFVLWGIGWINGAKFGFKRLVLSKLLSNAIGLRWLSLLYLTLFVVHVGWLGNVFNSLYSSSALLSEALYSFSVCATVLFFLILFFPDVQPKKIENPTKKFISGISALNYSLRNLKPLISMLNITDEKDTQAELFILHSNYYSDSKQLERINENFTNYYAEEVKNLDETTKATYDEELSKCLDITEKLRLLIKIAAMNMFPQKDWIRTNLQITFSKEQADYNSFDKCFYILNKFVKANDNEKNLLYFNLTPGTGIVGSLMTLVSIDGDRSLYYYSQDNSLPDDQRLQIVDKAQIPLQNLLSQALDTLGSNKK